MQSPFPFAPEQASNFAGNVDTLFAFILLTCLFFAVLITVLGAFASFRYRRAHPNEVGAPIHGNLALEIGWTAVPLFTALVMCAWGAVV